MPELSPRARFRAEIGYTHFRIDYGRPSIRGRKIMGEVVPFNRLWRTGGGPCTIIRFDEEVTINTIRLKPGAYAMVTIPGEKCGRCYSMQIPPNFMAILRSMIPERKPHASK
ncbi:MAG: DUF2911 domain-containing protein [Bacteroidia bacterium]|nr:DUF2911 domain-containing protein [Bacteroidia bacterium]